MSAHSSLRAAAMQHSVPEQTIRFLTTRDGVRLAYALAGGGAPLVKAPNWLSHLEYEWQSSVWRHWFEFLSRRNRLLRFDQRGSGLSDWTDERCDFEYMVQDLADVVDAAGFDRFPVIGLSQGAAVAVEYAVRNPHRVSHLILYGGYAQGWARRGHPEQQREGRTLVETMRIGWGADNPAFRQLWASLFIPDATEEQSREFTELMRRTTRPETAARLLEAFGQIDVSARLPEVRVPTLVLHVRSDARCPYDQGRMLAAGIPGATFVTLEGRNHILLENQAEWPRFCSAVAHFLGHEGAAPEPARAATAVAMGELTTRELQILRLVAAGASNLQISGKLFISEKTVRNHLTSIFDKLNVSSRSQAIVFARDAGI